MAGAIRGVFHGREQESSDAKARWFQSLSLAERMDYLCNLTDLILENNPGVAEQRDAQPIAGRIRIVSRPRL